MWRFQQSLGHKHNRYQWNRNYQQSGRDDDQFVLKYYEVFNQQDQGQNPRSGKPRAKSGARLRETFARKRAPDHNVKTRVRLRWTR